jgi:uncharacterized surface protein with fasciclin (FAS1) repeats
MRPRTLTAAALTFAFLIPAMGQAQEPPPMDAQPPAEGNNLVSELQAAGEFNTLISALEATGLAQPLATDGPFTLFAPTDQAFEAIPQETMDSLMQDPEALYAVLAYHVVPGEISSTELSGMDSAESAFGVPLQLQSAGGGVQVEGAQVINADQGAVNGVFHAIDEVLMPPMN